MALIDAIVRGWRGIALIAATYVYFLIFAQFAFVHRLAELAIADDHLTLVMAAMAAGGIVFSLAAGWSTFRMTPRRRVQVAFVACAAAALATLLPLSVASAALMGFAIGAALGMLTVTLVTYLPLWLGEARPLLQVGAGTGAGYLICNFPPLFNAGPRMQAVMAAMLCLIGIAAAQRTNAEGQRDPVLTSGLAFPYVLVAFTALVWFDSAAFFIIQSTPALKAGTWQGTAHLWTNGILHLAAALAAAVLLRLRGLSVILSVAVSALAVACLLLLDPSRALLASVFYPVGVSLYSVALVAYPSLLLPAASTQERARKAALIYAVAGWAGSAVGIGMGQHLGRVPLAFILIATAAVLGPRLVREHRREALAVACILLLALGLYRALLLAQPPRRLTSAVDRGRQVYIAEGCINCHSQYVRPHSPDVLMWGPTESIAELRRELPPLIGNRRQGPDLSQVGGRRSALWLRAHFIDPRQVSGSSFMPSFGYLFRESSRGDDLIAYLRSLRSADYPQQRLQQASWQPTVQPAWQPAGADADRHGAELFAVHCATCHLPNGATRVAWQTSFQRLPPNLQTGPLKYFHVTDLPSDRELQLARIIKFGIPNTDMPGHEYLADRDVVSLARWLSGTMPPPAPLAHLTGETP